MALGHILRAIDVIRALGFTPARPGDANAALDSASVVRALGFAPVPASGVNAAVTNAGVVAALGYAPAQAGEAAALLASPTLTVGVPTGSLSVPVKTSRFSGVLKAYRQTKGQYDNATVASVIANATTQPNGVFTPDAPAKILGYEVGLAAAAYPDVDSAAFYGENTGRKPLFTVTGPTFTVAGGVSRIVMPSGTPLAADDLAQMFRGLQILTNHVTRYTAFVDTWDPAGTWVQVVEGFGIFGAPTNATGQNPTGAAVSGGGPVLVGFGPITKIWGLNANLFLGGAPGDGFGPFAAKRAAGFEMGLFNNTSVDHTYLGEVDLSGGYSWGYDAIAFGSGKSSAGFIARGVFDVGFQARSGSTAGFMVDGNNTTALNAPGFLSTQTTGAPFVFRPGGPTAPAQFAINQGGSVEMGRQDVAAVSFIDMHSSGSLTNDGDVRIQASGGNPAVPFKGGLSIVCAGLALDGVLILQSVASLPSYANDAAAAAGGVPLSQVYRSGSQVMIRVT